MGAACADGPVVGDGAPVRGRILHEDGRRAPGNPVVVVESPSDVDPEVAAVLGSVGLTCAAGDDVGCRGRRETTVTADDGRFAVAFEDEDRPEAIEVASGIAAGPGELAGPTVSQRSALDEGETIVPDLRVWQPALGLSSAGAAGTVSWPALPEPDLGQVIAYRAVFALGDGEPVWTVTTTAPPV